MDGDEGHRAAVVDAVLGVLLTVLFAAEAALNLGGDAVRWDLLSLLVALPVAWAVARRWPLASVVLTGCGLAYMALSGMGSVAYISACAATAYLLGRRTVDARPAVAVFVGLALAFLVFFAVLAVRRNRVDEPLMQWFWSVLALVFLVVFPWFLGRFLRQRAELLAAGWQRAERLEHEQRIVAERERLRERTRIAEDMHDLLGHELALIALRAGALELDRDLDERHRDAAARLRETAGRATDTLHSIIGVLRDGPAPLDPVRGTAADLVARAADSGMDTRLTVDGDQDAVPVPVALAVSRVVQEALTNAAKHAPGAAVRVRIAHRDEETVVSVVNTAPPAGDPGAAGNRNGLIGLRERVRLLGGVVTARPGPDGGFAVTATIPHAGTVAPEPVETTRDVRAEARRSVRRGLITAIAVPACLTAVLLLVMFGYYSYSVAQSVLDPTTYAALRVGQPEPDVEAVLPRMQMMDAPRPPNPPGTGCRYYRANGAVFDFGVEVMRLCFADGRLAAKDIVTKRGNQ